MADSDAELTAERDAEGRWLSYHQIAAARGIGRASAARMARLHRWPRRKNNAGVTVCLVPLSYAEPEAERDAESRANPPEVPTEIQAEREAVSALRSALDTLRQQLANTDARANRAEEAAADLRKDVRVEAAGRVHAEAQVSRLEVQLAAAERSAKQAQGEVAMMARKVNEMTEAEAMRKGRGRWARLRAAWRGE